MEHVAMADCLFLDEDLISRRLVCDVCDIVYVKSIATAYDGLCGLFAEGGEVVHLVAPRGREAELDLLVSDLTEELSRGSIAND
jgi:hypothetical protein